MDIDTVSFLTSDSGQAALAAARETRGLDPHRRPAALARLGTPAQVRSVLAQDDLRIRAQRKVPFAEDMLFDAEALEQATSHAVAMDRAERWPGPREAPLADLGAGIGIDTLAAASVRPVIAVERDPVRAALLRWNLRAVAPTGPVEVICGDAAEVARRGGPLAFMDPARRGGGRRTRDPAAFEPPQAVWSEWLGGFGAAQVKLPPTAAGLPAFHEQPMEVVSQSRRARESRLFQGEAWGPLPRRRATTVPDGRSIEGDGVPWPAPEAVEPGRWLLDPDPSVTVAGLVGDLARRDGLAPIHPRIGYLTGAAAVSASPGRWLRVDAVLRARTREIDQWLAAHDIGELTIKTRGVAEDAAAWRGRLHPRGDQPGTIVVTRDGRDRWIAYGCCS